MKATITLCTLLVLGLTMLVAGPTALAFGGISGENALRGIEPAWMVLSGASLLIVASLVRRYVPDVPGEHLS